MGSKLSGALNILHFEQFSCCILWSNIEQFKNILKRCKYWSILIIYNVLSSMLLSQGAPYHQFNRSRESKISKLLWSEYTSTWNWTVSCMAPRWTGMWGALATSPPSGPNIAHEKSRRSWVQLNEKTYNWPWPSKMTVLKKMITDCVFINRYEKHLCLYEIP